MQTTLRLDDELCRQAKAQAAAQGISLTRLIEQAIREHLDRPTPAPRRRLLRLPVSTAAGGLVTGFSSLEEAVEAAGLSQDQRTAG
jgi:Ribbon-helix-helix protein, copG family